MAETHADIKKEMQKLAPETGLVSLFTLDASVIGGSVHHFSPGPIGGAPVVFNGIAYPPVEVKIENMSVTGKGKMPRPILTLPNVSKIFLAEVVAYDDLAGALVKRMRTYAKYLDGQSEANPAAYFPEDIFEIEQKLHHNKLILQFELKALVDVENKKVPRRQVLPICDHVYRRWTGSAFNYTNATCPYTDTDYYDITGQPTTADKDVCGQKLFDCKLRFPSTNNSDDQLPGRFFPGIGQFGRPYRR